MTEQPQSEPDALDQRLADWLVDYDSALLSGVDSASRDEPLPENSAEFVADVKCLEFLHRVWGEQRLQSPESASPGPASAESLSPEIPRQVGRFEVIRELGRGGYGIVLLAVDPHLDRHVAIKIPRPEVLLSTSLRERFLREAEAAGRLDHPNLVPVYEVDEAGPLWYIATACIAGGALNDWVQAEPQRRDPRVAAAILALLADAVQHAHSAGILHRDLKPGNVLMQPLAETSQRDSLASHAVVGFVPRLTDFGLAKLLEDDGAHTMSGTLLGTPSYMAPEQAAGESEVTGVATDVYGLGAILYELLSGEPPFRGGTSLETLRQVLQDEVRRPSRIRPAIPSDLEAICLKCLEKQPSRRYLTARELGQDIRRFLAGEPIEARATTPLERLTKWCRRKPALASFAGLTVAATMALVVGLFWSNIEISRALERAEESQRESQQLLYSADIRGAQQSPLNTGFGDAASVLAKHIPVGSAEDRREFGWHFLWSALHRAEAGLPAHAGDIYGVAFSPDGSRLATVGRNRYARVWEYPSLKPLATLDDPAIGAKIDINAVAYSPDGALLATGGDDAQLVIRDAKTHQVKTRQMHPHATADDIVSGMEFSPDGRRLYTACGAMIHVWDAVTWAHLLSKTASEKKLRTLAFSPDGKLLLTVRGEARVWSTETLELMAEFPKPARRSFVSGCFLADGKRLALGESQGVIAIKDVPSGASITRLRSSQLLDITSLAASRDGKYLIAGSSGRAVDVFDAESFDELAHLSRHSDRVWDVRCSPDGARFVSAGADGIVYLWRLPDGSQWQHASGRLTFFSGGPRIEGLAYSPDGKVLACGMKEKQVMLLDRRSGSVTEWPFDSETHGQLVAVSFVDDGRQLISCHEKCLLVWDRESGKIARKIEMAGSVSMMAINASESRLAIGLRDAQGHRVNVFDWTSARQVHSIPVSDQISVLAFTPDSRELVITVPGLLSVFDAQTYARRLAIGEIGESFHDIAFTPDGRHMIVAENRKGAAIREIATGSVVGRLTGHPGLVTAVAAHPNGRNVATLCDRDVLRLWDLDTMQPLLSFEDIRAPMRGGLRFDPLGNELALGQTQTSNELSIWVAHEIRSDSTEDPQTAGQISASKSSP